MDISWSKGCDIPTSELSHVQSLTSYDIFSPNLTGVSNFFYSTNYYTY